MPDLLPMTDTDALRAFPIRLRYRIRIGERKGRREEREREIRGIPGARGWYAGPYAGSESRVGRNKYVGKADGGARCVLAKEVEGMGRGVVAARLGFVKCEVRFSTSDSEFREFDLEN